MCTTNTEQDQIQTSSFWHTKNLNVKPILNRLYSLWRHQGFLKWEKKKHQKKTYSGKVSYAFWNVTLMSWHWHALHKPPRSSSRFLLRMWDPTLDIFLGFSLLWSCFLANSPIDHKANLARQCTVWVLRMQDNNCANVNASWRPLLVPNCLRANLTLDIAMEL